MRTPTPHLIARTICTSVVLFVFTIASSVFAEDRPYIIFINPDKPGNVFWDRVSLYMQYAARDLNVELEVHYAENRFHVPEIAKAVLNKERKPNYLLYIYQYAQTVDVLKLAEKAKVKSFIFNTNMTKSERDIIGKPREKYKYWIGHSYPDNANAAESLATHLFQSARKKHIEKEDGKLYVVALHGTRDSSVAKDYQEGLKRAISQTPNVKIQQQLYSNWEHQRAYRQSQGALRRHPEVNIIWTGNEAMALGAIQAAETLERTPGKDLMIGGTATSSSGIAAIRDGKLIANVGGDTIEGAWALTLLYDYHNGIDFYPAKDTFSYAMSIVNKDNLDEYAPFIEVQFWKNLNFKMFSRKYNEDIKSKIIDPKDMIELAKVKG